MRVLLMPRERDDRGAVAILTGLLVVALCVLSAFTIDLGMAYNSKRQLQVGADAGALAAAAVYAEAEDTNSCNTAFIDAHYAAALAAAQDYRDRNRSSAVDESFSVACADGGVKVTYSIAGDTATTFGRLAGVDNITTDRTAAALVDVPPLGTGVRPLAVCGPELPNPVTIGQPWIMYAPGNGHVPPPECPSPPTAGNWWTLDCGEELDPTPEQDGGGTSQMETQIRSGCTRDMTIVPGQGDNAGTALNDILAAACPSASTSAPFMCLSGDPGSPDAGQTRDAWKYLIDNAITITLPVFCTSPPCAGSSVVGTGTNAIFPVHRLVAVDVCGYHFGQQVTRRYVGVIPSAACAGAAIERAALMADLSDQNYLLFVFQRLQVSGSNRESECDLGDPDCDGGLRRVHLVE